MSSWGPLWKMYVCLVVRSNEAIGAVKIAPTIVRNATVRRRLIHKCPLRGIGASKSNDVAVFRHARGTTNREREETLELELAPSQLRSGRERQSRSTVSVMAAHRSRLSSEAITTSPIGLIHPRQCDPACAITPNPPPPKSGNAYDRSPAGDMCGTVMDQSAGRLVSK